MKRLFAPWRMRYVQQSQVPDCIFCSLQQVEESPASLVVARGTHAFVVLNRFPYTSGHLLVVANAHQPTLEDLTPPERAEMMELATRCMTVLRRIYHPQGFNLGANIGEIAGAGIAAHVHLHVVPRWSGDTNFMSAVGETRVLPEALEESWQRLRAAWGSV